MYKNFVFSIMDYMQENMVDILLVATSLIVILIFIITKRITITDKEIEPLSMRDAEKQLTISGNNDYDDDTIDKDTNDIEMNEDELSENFCKVNQGKTHILEEKCNKLENDTCKTTSCCVLASYSGGNTKCVAGTKLGPTYISDEKQNYHELEKYYYMNKCNGKNCN